MGKKAATRRAGEVRVPKVKCCVSKDRCGRCPIRLLAEGALPDGYAVRKRRLVREPLVISKKKSPSKKVAKLSSKKITKAELEKAVKQTRKNRKAARAA